MGLVPYWAKDIKIGFSTINAMAETVDKKPVFCDAFQRSRCLVPGKESQPYAIALADHGAMGLAGLWETWYSPTAETLRSFTIVTTEPNELCAWLHNRMPVILDPTSWPLWLGEAPAMPAGLEDAAGALALNGDDRLAG